MAGEITAHPGSEAMVAAALAMEVPADGTEDVVPFFPPEPLTLDEYIAGNYPHSTEQAAAAEAAAAGIVEAKPAPKLETKPAAPSPVPAVLGPHGSLRLRAGYHHRNRPQIPQQARLDAPQRQRPHRPGADLAVNRPAAGRSTGNCGGTRTVIAAVLVASVGLDTVVRCLPLPPVTAPPPAAVVPSAVQREGESTSASGLVMRTLSRAATPATGTRRDPQAPPTEGAPPMATDFPPIRYFVTRPGRPQSSLATPLVILLQPWIEGIVTMVQVVQATFRDGVFQPDERVELSDSTRVRLVVETLEADEPARRVAAWAALEQIWNTSNFRAPKETIQLVKSGMIAVDSNVLLYSVDRNEPRKQFIAQQLLQQLHVGMPTTVLLWQVLGEVTQQLRRWREMGKLTPSEYAQHLQAFRHLSGIAACRCV